LKFEFFESGCQAVNFCQTKMNLEKKVFDFTPDEQLSEIYSFEKIA
jgi:hypothetical protein